MNRHDKNRPGRARDEMTRRDFLRAGAVASLGLGLPGLGAARAAAGAPAGREMSCIVLMLVGGPGQLDTWDMKPDAPSDVRGPFRPIDTAVPGVQISELFPRMATLMDRVSLIRTVHHDATPVHHTGHQLLQTGRLAAGSVGHPHLGSVASYLQGPRGDAPPHVLIPRPIDGTGGGRPHGQDAGFLGRSFDPLVPGFDPDAEPEGRPALDAFDLSSEREAVRDRYGRTTFGQGCLMARRLVERGTRVVTVNQFQTVFHRPTWDCHGMAPFSSLADYPSVVAPGFDLAFSALIEDLDRTGRLESTMVLACGEFGRTPRLNRSGGRDHHPHCWTVAMAGGPIRGGRIVGASEAIGYEPKDRPVTPAEIAATIYRGLGLDLGAELPSPDGQPIRLVDPGVEPIGELF